MEADGFEEIFEEYKTFEEIFEEYKLYFYNLNLVFTE
ncbi:Uncharacterised protein [Streptococcus pneumoniae]|nr:Uncharacterised protein [Streptococcus pneumoniae]